MYKVFTTFDGKKKLIPEDKTIERHSAYGVTFFKNRILLISLKSHDKFWFPGGVINTNENSEQAVVREVLEETGVHVTIERHLIDVESYFYYDPQNVAWKQMSQFFLCTTRSDILPKFNNPDISDEADEPVWIEIESLSEENMQDYGYEVVKLVK